MNGIFWRFIRKNKIALSLILVFCLLCPNPQILANVSAESENISPEGEEIGSIEGDGSDLENAPEKAGGEDLLEEADSDDSEEDELEDEDYIECSERESNEASAILDGTPIEIINQLGDNELSAFVGHREALAVTAQSEEGKDSDTKDDDADEPPQEEQTAGEASEERADIDTEAVQQDEAAMQASTADGSGDTAPDDALEYPSEEIGMLEGDAPALEGGSGEDYPTGSANALGLQIHYVSEDDPNYVTKKGNFNLKYQIDFTADTFYKPGEMKIRVPAVLLEYRDMVGVKPVEIGVSEGTIEKPVRNKVSAFNYYYETIDGVEYITFFNYDQVNMSDIASIQVLYKSINVMSVADGTSWDLPATVTVYEGTDNESVYTTPNCASGKVETTATVNVVKKIPEPKVGSHFPELYTQNQVQSILGRLPDIIAGDKFKNYKYIVWRIEAKGMGNQIADIFLDECSYTIVNGKRVEGIVLNSGFQKSGDQYEKALATACNNTEWEYSAQKKNDIKVVVAYPVAELDNTNVYNNATIRVVPLDSPQKENKMTCEAECVYHNYDWRYPGDDFKLSKIGSTDNNGREVDRAGGLNAYKISSENGEDFVSVPFISEASMRSYEDTHYTGVEPGHERGEYKPDTSYTLVLQDAATYVSDRDNTNQETYTLLNQNDYYFNSVTIESEKKGYDVYEDVETAPVYRAADTGLIVYAMYGATPGVWSSVATASFDSDGKASYSFTADQIAKRPYRLKCEVTTTDYSVKIKISSDAMLKANSPNIAKLIKNTGGSYNSVEALKIIDYCGASGYAKKSGAVIKTYGDTKDAKLFPTDAPSSLKNMIKTKQGALCNDSDTNFDGYMHVKSARNTISSMYETSAMEKKYKISNDSKNGRTNIKYFIGALDGYYIENKNDKAYMELAGTSSPVRSEVVFYDLLPYGVSFDPSAPITAGRLNGMTNFLSENNINKSQVSVTVDPSRDVTGNYNGTGRTLVAFHLKYSGGDAGVYQSHKWCENWGLVFGAYYEWKDKGAAANGVNIAAFMPEVGDNTPLLGDPSSNDGSYIQRSITIEDSNKPLISYIKDTRAASEGAKRNVLYAQCRINEDIATADTLGVYKYVRSDEDRFGTFSKSAFVDCGKGYSYDITIKNTKDSMANIVFFDRLESEEESQWRGIFGGVLTTDLESQNVKPVIYYSTSPTAPIATRSIRPSAALTEANGWYTAEQFKSKGYNLSQVRSVAVDVSKKTDGSDFVLEANSAASMRIQMKAPDSGIINKNAVNTAMYCAVKYQDSTYVVSEASDEAVVTLGKPIDMVIEKHISEKTLESKRDEKFSFLVVDDNGYAYANKEYYVYEKVNGAWSRLSGIHSTTSEGEFELKGNQRAVFKGINEVNRLNVKEIDSLYWECHVSDTKEDTPSGLIETSDEEGNLVYRRTVEFTNTYHPLLFMSKKAINVPDTVDVKDYTFKFQISINGKSEFEDGLKYAYVVKERRDGVSPQVDKSCGDDGYAKTDKDGYFTLHVGEIIAFNGLFAGDEYVIKEILPKDADFLCAKDSAKGTLKELVSSASIENNYRYRDLDLKKELTNQSADKCTQEFTFRVCISDNSAHIAPDGKKYNGTPVSGNTWVVLDENGNESEDSGILSADGEFACAAAGKTVRIKGLDAGVKYIVTETDSGEDYRPTGKGSVSVTMPENGNKKAASITNDYLLRDFKVTKKVYYNEDDAADTELALSKEFTMNARINGSPLSTCEYTIQENGVTLTDGSGNAIVKKTDADGSFTLKHGQSAIFKEAGKVGQSYKVTETPDSDYPQSLPSDIYGNATPAEGYLSNTENEAVIGNGFYGLDMSPKIIISKKITSGDDQASKDYLDLLRDTQADGFDARRWLATSRMNVEITASNGNKYTLPANLECMVFDEWKNVTETVPVEGFFAEADGKVIKVLPGQSISVTASQLGEALFGAGSSVTVTSISVTEAETGYQHVVYTDDIDSVKKYTIALGQINPAEDGVLTKKISSVGATQFDIVNQIDVVEDAGSVIQKKMTFESKSVPKGSTLVWQVQRYTSGKWLAADGVKYFVDARSGGASVSKDTPLLTTGKDGKLTLKKSDSGMPKVQFMQKVYLNRTTPTEGDLQVVELLEESDDSWGYLAGYGRKKSGTFEYDMTYSSESDDSVKYFVNTNNLGCVKVQKDTPEATDDMFSMVVKRVTKLDDDSGRQEVKESIVASGIGYDVYDAKTRALLRSGVTDLDGTLNIMSGQYANLKIPNDLYFTVQEKTAPNYNMIRLTASDKEALTQLKDNVSEGANDDNSNSILIKTAGEPRLGRDTNLTHDDFLNGITNAITEEPLIMSQALDTGLSEIVIPEYFYRPGDNTLYHVVGVEGGSEETPTCDFRNSYNPDTDSPNTPHIKSLTLPDSILNVGEYAFAFGEGLENVHLPENLVRIEGSAFRTYGREDFQGNSFVEVNLPNSVNFIGEYGLALKSPLIEGDITLESPEIKEHAFGANSVIDGSITINSGELSGYAFDNTIITKDIVLTDCAIGATSFALDYSRYKDETELSEYAQEILSYLDKAHVNMTITGGGTSLVRMTWGKRVIDKLSIGGNGLTDLVVVDFLRDLAILEVDILEGVENVGQRTFANLKASDVYYNGEWCTTGVKKLTIPGTITRYENNRSYAVNPYLEEVVWKDGAEIITSAELFSGDSSLKSITLPSTLKQICKRMFRFCSSLESIEIPGSVTDIGEEAFDSNTALNSVILNEGLLYIRKNAFSNTALGSIELPSTLKTLNYRAFDGTAIDVYSLKLPEGAQLSGA